MEKLLRYFEKHHFIRWTAIISVFVGWLGALTNLAIWMNWVPGYEIRIVRADSVQPQVHLFPAQKIRLTPSFIDGSQTEQVENAAWYLKKKGVIQYTLEGLHPSVTIPEGGIYKLEVTLGLTGEDKERKGSANLYVVQDEPTTKTTESDVSIPIDASEISNSFIESARKLGLEVYQGASGWKRLDHAVVKESEILIPKNTELSTFTNQILLRARGESVDLSKYGSVTLPAENK